MIIVFGKIFPAAALANFVWRRCTRSPDRAWPNALWIAFYMALTLFVYDYLYLAVHQSRGWVFLETRWYLTAFYVIPWLLLPVIAVRVRAAHKN